MLEKLTNLTGSVSDVLYTYVLVILLVAGGLYFAFRTKFAQITSLPHQFKAVTEKPKDKKNVSSFQALMVSTASRVGTGNIVGVAAAIVVGGYGSVFWMWVIALIGAASAFVESTLAQIYKKRGPEGSYGGPAYYIEKGLKCRPLAIVFSVLLIFTYGIGFNMLASYNLQDSFSDYGFYQGHENLMPWIIGIAVALLVALCLFGGGKRLVKTTEALVPMMGIAYILIALVVVCLNLSAMPTVFSRIFREAFDFEAIFGGFAGSCIMLGIKRGLFSNEAGVGSAPNASASAEVSHPAKQGLVQVLSVFIDTILVCSATAFMCMSVGLETGAYQGADGPMSTLFIKDSLRQSLGEFGPIFLTVATVLFAFTTLLGNLYYVKQAFNHILGHVPGKKFNSVVYVIASAAILVGAGLSAGLLWNVADIAMALMAIINIPVILILGKYAFRALKDYKAQKKAGQDPVFHSKDIGLPDDVDYWD